MKKDLDVTKLRYIEVPVYVLNTILFIFIYK